jgi:hypothetical protein
MSPSRPTASMGISLVSTLTSKVPLRVGVPVDWRSWHSLEMYRTGDVRRKHCGPPFTYLALVEYCRRSEAGRNLASSSRAGNLETKTTRVTRQSISSRSHKQIGRTATTHSSTIGPITVNAPPVRPLKSPVSKKPTPSSARWRKTISHRRGPSRGSSESNWCRLLLSRARRSLADLMKPSRSRSDLGGPFGSGK